MLKLNLGANDKTIPGFLSVDIAPPADVVTDLRERWPWDDSSVDEVVALDVFEHLPDRIHTMNELWRVMAPGAVALVEVPNAAKGAGHWQDPTHCAPWCLNSFQYYEAGSAIRKRLGPTYGIRAEFELLSLQEYSYTEREVVSKIVVHLRAIK